MNLRTVEGGTKARLQKAADERHAWSLQQSKDEVEALKQNLEEDTYMMMLDKEAAMLRAKKKSMKDRETLKVVGEREKKLQALVTAAEVMVGGLQRDLSTARVKSSALDTKQSEAQKELQALKF